jgi:hypothetical protein
MMEQGREMQQQHLSSLQSIFENVWGGANKEAGEKPASDDKPA